MANVLTPTHAAAIAASTYLVRTTDDMGPASRRAQADGMFGIQTADRFVGESGLVGFKQASGFGYVARGEGAWNNEALVAVRGTKTGADWLTDFRFGATFGPHGHLVHVGFWDAVKAVLPRINASLAGTSPHCVHVVGHSLGGAMATLIAAVLRDQYPVKLYTFAAPRSGMGPQAVDETARIGEANIRRVYHDNDIVPMVPLWPYTHVPYGKLACRLPGPGGLLSINAHFMESYIASVDGHSWADLARMTVPDTMPLTGVREWLEAAAANSGSGFLMGSSWVLDKLLAALGWIIDMALKASGVALSAMFLPGATILDALAKLLHSGVLLAADVAETMGYWVAIALRWLGITAARGVSLSAAVIRYVLERLRGFIEPMVRRALNIFD